MTVDLKFVPTPVARIEVDDGARVIEASPRFATLFGEEPDARLDTGSFAEWARLALQRGAHEVDARVDGQAMRLSFRAADARTVIVGVEPRTDLRFQQIVEESPDIIAVIDRQCRHVFVNRAIEAATGLSPRDFEGKDHVDLGMPDELVAYFQGVYLDVFATGEEGAKEFAFPTASGALRSYTSRVVPLREPDGRIDVVLSYARDITERLHAEEERLGLERKLQETQRLESLGLLAGGIAHDFNNLLTSILGNASLARATASPGDRALEQIESAALRAAELCMQMLSYAGLRARHEQPVSVVRLVRDLVDLVGASSSKNARLVVDTPDDAPWALADRSQLQQVVMNFLINGLEALPAGLGTIEVRVREVAGSAIDDDAVIVPSNRGGRFVEVSVRDTGSGMDPATLARVFDPFFTTKFTGRGLGLAATLGIVRAHGGGLAVKSALGAGTAFTVWLRAVDPVTIEAPMRPSHVPSLRVLLVDDEDSVRAVTAMMLESAGHAVVACRSGAEALERLERPERQELVLLDLTMPGLDGLDTLERLRERAPNLPVVLMSGYGEERLRGRLESDPATRFLQKPFRYESLQEIIASFYEPGEPPSA